MIIKVISMKIDELKFTNHYLELPSEFYDRVKPTPLTKPHLIHANKDILHAFNIDEEELEAIKRSVGAK